MVLLGCKPQGRLTEQHDIFFGIAEHLKDLLPAMKSFWPEAKGNFHLDAWREVTQVGDYKVNVVPKKVSSENFAPYIFFINLGGYKPGEFEEFHYKMLVSGKDSAEAIQLGKQTAFYKHTGFKGATSHIDDKYGIDTDDIFKVEDILDSSYKEKYSLEVSLNADAPEDKMNLGYIPIKKLLSY